MTDFLLKSTGRIGPDVRDANMHFKGSVQADRGLVAGTDIEAAPLLQRTVLFTEADGSAAGVYTGSVEVPPGAIITDIIVTAMALWDADTSATMIVGDGDDDNGFYTAINLKATDLLAGESICFAAHGGKVGAYIVGTVPTGHWEARYDADARTITGQVTTVGTVGTAGVTRMTVIYAPAPAVLGEVASSFVAS